MKKELQKQVDEVRIEMEDIYRNRLQYEKKQITLRLQVS